MSTEPATAKPTARFRMLVADGNEEIELETSEASLPMAMVITFPESWTIEQAVNALDDLQSEIRGDFKDFASLAGGAHGAR